MTEETFKRELCNKNPDHAPCPNIKPYCNKLHVCRDLKETQDLVERYCACMYGQYCNTRRCPHFHFE